ncbi:hypothetical protein L596_027472 [Steinernema carpocapsae]|uniref:Purple acid phosphatase n=1 Tax=Steinernema carpocapsae TaxID=34508 RepID=A0A4U5LVL3_STECR|nr:hypothetical protein L596_027472 [Steinernema carpocapsae]
MWSCLVGLLALGLFSRAAQIPPEQVHLSLNHEPDQMVVTWVTFKPLQTTPQARFGDSPDYLTNSVDASTTDFVFNGTHRFIYRTTMTHLKGKTYYKVGSKEGWSQTFNFQSRNSLSVSQRPLKICVFGDLGVINGQSMPHLVNAAQNNEFDLVIHLGDIAYDLHSEDGERGDKYMRDLEPLAAYIPYMVIAGNHEDDRKNFSHYVNRFTMPDYDQFQNHFYSFDYGPIHFVGVSTEFYGYYYDYGMESVETQYNWLNEDLKKADRRRDSTPWIISYQHRPFYCSNENSKECSAFENRLIRKGFLTMPGLEDLYTSHGVDLGFWGHEHSYERFLPVSNRVIYNDTANPYDNAAAPIYVISGSAGCHSGHAWFDKKPVPFSAKHFFRRRPIHVFDYTCATATPSGKAPPTHRFAVKCVAILGGFAASLQLLRVAVAHSSSFYS